jgi:type II secretory pathway pseudopilin PulG
MPGKRNKSMCFVAAARRLPRGGYSLVELLIVMGIMIMLVSMTLPMAKHVMEDGKVREASRAMSAFFAVAKARALSTGQPCGVWMVCDAQLNVNDPTVPASPAVPLWPVRQVTQLYLAESPPSYGGSTSAARGRIMQSLDSSQPVTTYEFHPLVYDSSTGGYIRDVNELAFIYSMVAPGEQFLVQFDHKGPRYVCIRPASSPTSLIFQTASATGVTEEGAYFPAPPCMSIGRQGTTPLYSSIAGFSFEITRMPKRIGNPMQMTAGSCIDMTYSGIGPNNMPTTSLAYGMYPSAYIAGMPTIAGIGLAPLQGVVVMFGPGGNLDSIYLVSNTYTYIYRPPTSVHFLVGRSNKVAPPNLATTTHPTGLSIFDPETSNLADPQSLWVSVSRQTGAVVTADNMPPPIDLATASTSAVIFNPGTPQQYPSSGTANPTLTATQTWYLTLCRQLATNRDQTKGQ